MKIISYNVNGIRAAIKKGFVEWLSAANPDVICLQETKARQEQVDMTEIEALGYKHYWFSAQKAGYSGVAIFSKTEPDHVSYGCDLDLFQNEGRIIQADFGDVSIISVYIPSGTTGDVRQDIKMNGLGDFIQYISKLRKSRPNLVVAGDYNICHTEIDIHNPVANKNTSGFLPEERDWLSEFIASGMVDSFRHLNQEPHNYSWWSYRANSRANNKGWRIDYNMVSEPLKDKIKRVGILKDAMHSDHAPILLELSK